MKNELIESTRQIVKFLKQQIDSIDSDNIEWFNTNQASIYVRKFVEISDKIQYLAANDEMRELQRSCAEKIANELYKYGSSDMLSQKVEACYTELFHAREELYNTSRIEDSNRNEIWEQYAEISGWYQGEKYKAWLHMLNLFLDSVSDAVLVDRSTIVVGDSQTKSPNWALSRDKSQNLWMCLLDHYIHYIPFDSFYSLMNGKGGNVRLHFKCDKKNDIQQLIATFHTYSIVEGGYPPYSQFEEISYYNGSELRNLSSSGTNAFPEQHHFSEFCQSLTE